jgi:hypothetical protein
MLRENSMTRVIYNCIETTMKFDLQKYRRKSIRLKGYDYSQVGVYFVTIVAWRRESLFGEIIDGKMKLNRHGEIVEWEWQGLPIRLRYQDFRLAWHASTSFGQGACPHSAQREGSTFEQSRRSCGIVEG